MRSNWTSFHTHTVHSILDGMSMIPDLVNRAVELEMPAIGISDHGTLSGAYELWREATKAGIKPVIGMEAYVAPESRFTKSPVFWGATEQRKDDLSFGAYSHMLLIAKNAEGLRNLYKLHELSYTEGFYYHPRIDLELLETYGDGLAVTTGCAGGAVATYLRLGRWNEALEYTRNLRDIFGADLYVEVMYHGIDFEVELNRQLIELAEIVNLPLLATNDSHYTRKEDGQTHQALLCVQTRSTLEDPKFVFSGGGYWLRSYDEMAALPLPREALDNTLKLAERVESYDEVFEKRDMMPKTHPTTTACGHRTLTLRSRVMDRVGAMKVSEMAEGANHSWYEDRAQYELDVIEEMGYEDYFLVIADLVAFARHSGVLVGPGRGSVGGSLVAFLLGITDLDPLQHNLIFERFLNPERLSPPDIDIDIQDDRRDEVIQYIADKYGHDHVAQIITFGTIKAKSAVKDACRVLGRDYSHGESLVALIPPDVRGRQHPLKGLTKLQEADPEVYRLATGLEGLVRNTGKHAAGIIVSPEPLPQNIPVKQGKGDDWLTTVYDQETLEDLGYTKIDILGLKELSVIQIALEYINR